MRFFVLTDAADGEHSHRLVRWLAFGEEGLEHVDAEGERNDGLRARPHDHALDPQTDESEERAERRHDVGIVGARLRDHAAQFGVAVGAGHREDARRQPHQQRHVDAARVDQHARR